MDFFQPAGSCQRPDAFSYLQEITIGPVCFVNVLGDSVQGNDDSAEAGVNYILCILPGKKVSVG